MSAVAYEIWLLSVRAVRESFRQVEGLVFQLFVPVFFLMVNIGQVSKVFQPETTDFLQGQNYAAFALPVSLLFAASTASSGIGIATDIDHGYMDKLRVAPIRRTSLVLGRLASDFVRGVIAAIVILAVGLAFDVRIESGWAGGLALILLTGLWSCAYAGFGQVMALVTKSVQTTNASSIVFFPLLFLTPNFVPRELLAGPMEVAATYNPVTYVVEGLRSLILEGWDAGALLACVVTIVGVGAVLTALSLRAVNRFGE